MSVLSRALNADIPLHHQIYLHLRAEIEDGLWVGRDDFPGENELAAKFGVSVITSRKALSRLVEDGWIDRGRGRRTRVVRSPTQPPASRSPEIIQTAKKPGVFSYEVLSRGLAQAPGEACAAFGYPSGSKLWLCQRVRRFRGEPHSVTMNVQPVDLGSKIPIAKLQRLPMSQILRDMGVELKFLRRRVSAALAPPLVAQQLGLTMNDPTLVYTFTHHDGEDRPVQWVRIWVHPAMPAPEEVLDYSAGTWSTSAPM